MSQALHLYVTMQQAHSTSGLLLWIRRERTGGHPSGPVQRPVFRENPIPLKLWDNANRLKTLAPQSLDPPIRYRDVAVVACISQILSNDDAVDLDTQFVLSRERQKKTAYNTTEGTDWAVRRFTFP